MAYQQLVKTRLSWEEKLERFAAAFGPFTAKWDEYRAFTKVEGGYTVYYPRLGNAPHPFTEEKPLCAACGSHRPMGFRYLTDHHGFTHLVGEDCYRRLHELHHVTLLDFVSPIPTFHSEDKAG